MQIINTLIERLARVSFTGHYSFLLIPPILLGTALYYGDGFILSNILSLIWLVVFWREITRQYYVARLDMLYTELAYASKQMEHLFNIISRSDTTNANLTTDEVKMLTSYKTAIDLIDKLRQAMSMTKGETESVH